MLWHTIWPGSLLALLSGWMALSYRSPETNASSPFPRSQAWSAQRKLSVREKTRSFWYHGFDNYMKYAFPMDELTPLSCSGQGPDWGNPRNIAANDVAGNFSLTLIDVLDTLVVLDDREGFENAVKNVIDWVTFDVNTKPQVFETTIRVLGGLLSAHMFANSTGPFHLPWYSGELLTLAHELGERLLPAFSTPTGIPYARVNLRQGVMKGESRDTCTAGAGSLILEFAALSRWTGDERFEKAAKKAFFALWNRKSNINLVGNTINTATGEWTAPEVSTIGAGVDSFFEYALKWYIMSGEVEFLDVWDTAYTAIMRHSRASDGFWYHMVNMKSGETAYYTVDSLSAFWPGLQVLAGDVQNAIKLHMMYWNLWQQHSGLPEVYDTSFRVATSHQYPLRPEFIESTWYLYRATKDPFYLDVGERVLEDLIRRAKVECGIAGIADLRTNKVDDRMESFALSETLKYLFLLFDEENPLHSDDSNYVFTTEGHILSLTPEYLKPVSAARRKLRGVEAHQCPVIPPYFHDHRQGGNDTGLTVGVESRGFIDYARNLVSLEPSNAEKALWSSSGWCETPRVFPFSYEFILSADGKSVPEDLSPSKVKLAPVDDGYVLNNITGVRIQIVQRLDGRAYDVRKLAHYDVRPGQLVYINDTAIFTPSKNPPPKVQPAPAIQLRFFTNVVDPVLNSMSFGEAFERGLGVVVTAYTGHFGGDPSVPSSLEKPVRFLVDEGLPIFRDPLNPSGCSPYSRSHQDAAILVWRGKCTFLEKVLMAKAAGAAGVIVINDDEAGINPTAGESELDQVGDLDDIVILVITKSAAQKVLEMMTSIEQGEMGSLMLRVEQQELAPTPVQDNSKEDRILYINGHGLTNTRLLV